VRRLGGTHDIPIAVRVLAATNRAPEKAVENKQLREDLYYRLNVFHLSLPPLRERLQDIPAIATALIRDLNRKHGCRATHLAPDVLQRLQASTWPGNVRELRNVIERAVIVAGEGEIQLRHLPWAVTAVKATPAPAQDGVLQLRAGSRMSDVEEAYLKLTLKHTNNNRRQAAEMLGLCLRTLHNKLRSYEAPKAKAAAVSSGKVE
jgi:transcriptional regulator with PAS, ATPase and Fis domain